MGRVAGKVAFITHAGRAQGRRHAVRLAEEGADIIAVDTISATDTVARARGATNKDLTETAGLVEATGRRAVTVDADVRDLRALAAAAAKGWAELGRLDVVIADANIPSHAPALEMPEQTWQDLIDINLTGIWKTLKATIPYMIEGERGGAVVITNSPPTQDSQSSVRDDAAKAGLVMLMKETAKEVAQYRIRVNSVHPTTAPTDLVFDDPSHRIFRPDPGDAAFERQASTLTRMPVATLDPDDVTNAVLYLVSDDGCYVTGTTHVVDASGAA